MEVSGSRFSLLERVCKCLAMAQEVYKSKPTSYWILLILSSLELPVAVTAASLLSRVYYDNGGTSKWIISWVAVAGWPIHGLILIPTYIFFKISPTPLNLYLFLSYVFLGFLNAAHNLMFAYASAYLSASTADLLDSASLVFAALFGFWIVKNKLNASMINAIVIITSATALIALDADSKGNEYVSNSHIIWGIVWDILTVAIHSLIYALSELVFVKFLGRRSFHVVLELRMMVSFFGFVFTTIGVIVNKDFKGMVSEAKSFKSGETTYNQVLIWGAITFQLVGLGGFAVLYLVSTVMAGVLFAVSVPLTSIAAVILFHDPMSGLKILSLVNTFWGLASFIYGTSRRSR